MTSFALRSLSLLFFLLLTVGCGSSATPSPTPTPASTPTAEPTPDIRAVVRRVLAEEFPTPTAIPRPSPAADVISDADLEEITERVLDAIAAMPTPTPSPTPEPTPTPVVTPTPSPTPTLPTVIRKALKSMVRIRDTGANGGFVGTGVVVEIDATTGDFYVVTNQRLVREVTGLEITVIDGGEYAAEIHGSDEERDLALLRVCCEPEAVPVTFGDALTLQAGADVVAMGFSKDAETGATVSRGILSAIRYDPTLDRWIIQTDAPLGLDSSGGPLMTPDGRLIGININNAGDSENAVMGNFGFAISEVTLSLHLPDLREQTASP